MAFDITRVRSEYPALAEGTAPLDGAAGTLVAAPVAAAVGRVLTSAVSNRGTAFEAARRSGEIVDAARVAVADLVGGDPSGVVFGPSATGLTYLVARTLSASWGPGDEVVVSRLDHDANVRPWVQAAVSAGATVRWAAFDPGTGALPTSAFAELIGPRTRVVAVTAASNAIGTIPDVPAIAALARSVGALTYVDGVHATPHLPVDVTALGADFYVTSAYKWSGPHIAAVVAAPSVWSAMEPAKLMPSPDTVPDRFEFGTQSFELLAGVTAAVDHLASLSGSSAAARRERVLESMAAAHAYEMGVFGRLTAGLSSMNGVTVLPAPDPRCPTVSFRADGVPPDELARALGDAGVCVFAGDYYAYEYFTAMGLRDTGGAVRAGIYHYNTDDDVERLLSGVASTRRSVVAGS
jgi:cysteine desulfurase family protein (TIGR01976 family)